MVQRNIAQLLPVARRVDHTGERRLRSFDRSGQATEEPLHPRRNLHRRLLRPLENAVVLAALFADLRRHAVEPLRTSFRSGERHVGDRPGNPAVAIVEWMNRHEPEMRESGFQHRFSRRVTVEPLEEQTHFFFNSLRRGRLEVDAFTPYGTGHDLHRCRAGVAPRANCDAVRPAPSGSEQRRMPAKEALGAEPLVIVLRRVEHHFDDAFDVTVSSLQAANVDAESARDRRADLFSVQLLAFDLAALQHVFGECTEYGLLSDSEAERLHLPNQTPLQLPGSSQRSRQFAVVPMELWPVLKLMDVRAHSPHVLR